MDTATAVMLATFVQDLRRWDHLIESWSPGIGRHSTAGWILLAATLAASVLCLRRCRILLSKIPGRWADLFGGGSMFRGLLSARGRERPYQEPRWWLLLSASQLLIGLARLLHLGDWITITFRNLLVRQRMYEDRWALQVPFSGIVLIAVGLATYAVVRRDAEWTPARDLRLALIGTLVAWGLFAVRAGSFHFADQVLALGWKAFRLGSILEAASVTLVLFGALCPPRPPAGLDQPSP